jgi:hypothetical protein
VVVRGREQARDIGCGLRSLCLVSEIQSVEKIAYHDQCVDGG